MSSVTMVDSVVCILIQKALSHPQGFFFCLFRIMFEGGFQAAIALPDTILNTEFDHSHIWGTSAELSFVMLSRLSRRVSAFSVIG